MSVMPQLEPSRPTSIAGGTESGNIPLTLRSHEPMEFPQLGK